eukprot:2960761-Prymnesium_polylepis.1
MRGACHRRKRHQHQCAHGHMDMEIDVIPSGVKRGGEQTGGMGCYSAGEYRRSERDATVYRARPHAAYCALLASQLLRSH